MTEFFNGDRKLLACLALRKLRYAADAAIAEVIKHRQDCAGEAINWASLSCDTHLAMSEYGEERLVVEIEEADPGCPIFHGRIRKLLAKAGFDGVEVRTEW